MSIHRDFPLLANELTHRANDNDQVQYQLWFPFAKHPTWQLIPIVGNTMVFIDTVRFVRAVNSLFVLHSRDQLLVYLKITAIFVFGMVPCLGFLLTLALKPCLCYMSVATASLPTYGLRGPKTPFNNVIDMFSPCNLIHNNLTTQCSQQSKQSDMTVIDLEDTCPQFFSPLVHLPEDSVQEWMDSACREENESDGRVSLSNSVEYPMYNLNGLKPTDVNRESLRTRCMRNNMVYPNKQKSSSCTSLDHKSRAIAKDRHTSLSLDKCKSLKIMFPLEKEAIRVGRECLAKNSKGLRVHVL
ncbi:hypothetical protein FBU59_000519 [Linderina macrospora]|uniref:Uncharacterized protein n=1 Tax=Linderina macrospora TaxID=4868 RepID=A0ACC1JGL3_9FUNG|nr:hypothetical protein FBU59_000519 [Linderina macrospora]